MRYEMNHTKHGLRRVARILGLPVARDIDALFEQYSANEDIYARKHTRED